MFPTDSQMGGGYIPLPGPIQPYQAYQPRMNQPQGFNVPPWLSQQQGSYNLPQWFSPQTYPGYAGASMMDYAQSIAPPHVGGGYWQGGRLRPMPNIRSDRPPPGSRPPPPGYESQGYQLQGVERPPQFGWVDNRVEYPQSGGMPQVGGGYWRNGKLRPMPDLPGGGAKKMPGGFPFGPGSGISWVGTPPMGYDKLGGRIPGPLWDQQYGSGRPGPGGVLRPQPPPPPIGTPGFKDEGESSADGPNIWRRPTGF